MVWCETLGLAPKELGFSSGSAIYFLCDDYKQGLKPQYLHLLNEGVKLD